MRRIAWCLALLLAGCPSGGADLPDAAETHDDAGDTLDAGDDTTPDASDAFDAGETPDAASTTEDAGNAADAGEFVQPPLWDTTLIEDASTADCTFTNQRARLKDGVTLTVWDLSYVSYESIDGTLHPIRIKAFVAKPTSLSGRGPAVVQAHGLGGNAQEAHATGLAAKLGTIALAYTGPGGGSAAEGNDSEGRPSGYDNGKRMFDTIPDLRGTWFWGHAMAAMRGVTCLVGRADVDASKLGMTGFSAGAVATLIVSAADRRVIAGVPLSGTHAWRESVKAPNAWQHKLLQAAGYDVNDPHWIRLQEGLIDPAATAAHIHADVLMVNGSTDEFFPVNAHVATFDAIPGGTKRTSFAANFDHGCYSLTGIESGSTIESRADLHAVGGQKAWFAHALGTDSRFATLPAMPTATMTPVGAVQGVVATVDESVSTLAVDDVRLWWTTDGLLWGDVQLSRQGANTWGDFVAIPGGVPFYVDVTYKTRDILGAERFTFSTRPTLPDGFVPAVRSIDSCQ